MIQASNLNNISELLLCYDDANLLFDEAYRAPGTEDIIRDVIQNNQVYHYSIEGEIVGFIGYKLKDTYAILNALYVKRQYHGKKVADELLTHIEEEIDLDYLLTTYLNMAPWSDKFYRKKGFKDVAPVNQGIMAYYESKKRPYSTTLIKALEGIHGR